VTFQYVLYEVQVKQTKCFKGKQFYMLFGIPHWPWCTFIADTDISLVSKAVTLQLFVIVLG
jgi:hypothetical protein